MATLAAALAAIPLASHLVQHLHLKSRLPRRDGDVTVCTHCSLDRLDRLEAQAFSWSGVISAAVMCPCPCEADSLRAAKQFIRALHGRVQSSGAPCRLDIILVSHPPSQNSVLSSCQDPWRYPINALRNIALRSASTELVVSLDVDFLPGSGIQEHLWKMDVYSGYLRACTDLKRVIILPAFEEASASETISAELAFGDKDHIRSALEIVAGGKTAVEKLWTRGKLRVFAAQKYPRGHGATDTERWISSDASYEVEYEVDYEPYFLCARRLVPWFDERFTGYGKNKIIHAFHTAVLDFRFWVHPEWYLVHVYHDNSRAWEATLGSDPHASTRLSDIRRLYAIAKHELLSLPTHSGVHLPPTPCACGVPKTPLVPRKFLSSWKMGHGEHSQETGEMGHWASEDQPSHLLLQTGSKKYLQALYDLRYHFCVPKIRPVVGDWPLRSKLPRSSKDISLVTVATADRLQRLLAQCRRWKGVICAAIYAPPGTNVKDLEEQLRAFHLEIEKAGTCRLDLILMEPPQPVKSNRCMRFGRKAKSPHDLCPINRLRNAALELATTDLVLILDVDLLPSHSLNDCFLDGKQYECLTRMAMDERTAVVVPSFEYAVVATLDTPTENGKVEDRPPSQRQQKSSSAFEMGKEKKGLEKGSTSQEVRCISDTQEMTEGGIEAICSGLDCGRLRGFHVKHYPAGHSPTNFEKWRKMSSGSSNVAENPCCEVCRSYRITFAEGFEPFIICARKLIPSFDERFRGYGFDKVTFFYHLHLSGFQFRVLSHSFALDIPHSKSKDWTKTFGPRSDPLQRIRVKALYKRAKREIRVVTGGSALANHVVDQLPVHFSKSAKPLPGLSSKSRKQFRSSSAVHPERENRSILDGLQLAWEGVIQREYSDHQNNSSDFLEGDTSTSSSHSREEDEELSRSMGSEIVELPQRKHVAKQISRLFGWNSFWANSVAFAASESKTFDSINSSEPLEELEWDSTGWELKCSSDSLSNCSVVKAPLKESSGEKEWFQTGDCWLRVFMSAGSWSPQASRLAGITTGGVCVRSVLPMRTVKEVVVRYMVRFPSSFEWVKGGALPGLWVNDILQASFGWRRGGEGHLSTALIGLPKPETEERSSTSFTAKTSKLSRPFYFVPEQWHALQIAISVVDGQTSPTQDRSNAESTSSPMGNTRSSPRLQTSVKNGAMVELRAFVDFELVSTITYPFLGGNSTNSSRNGRDSGRSVGLLLSCYFGGKTKDWAPQEDTHIDFSRVIISTIS